MSREGEARRPALREPPRPCPLRCGLTFQRARRVKVAREVGLKSGSALVSALTAVLRLGSRTEAASSKGSQRT